jgi:predicted metal-dependent enzyme (double-stranded beta helix superfamily)
MGSAGEDRTSGVSQGRLVLKEESMLAEPGVTPEMRRFVGEVARIVGEGGGERIVTQRVAAGLSALLRERNVLDERHTRPKLDQYALYPVWIAPRGEFSIAAAVWGVGQVTPIHDHGTWGVIGIYRGVEHETRYGLVQASGAGPLQRLSERDIREGEVIVCCTSDQDIHQVSCGSKIPCVGIHVYGADIGRTERHVYDSRTGARRTFIAGWAEADE